MRKQRIQSLAAGLTILLLLSGCGSVSVSESSAEAAFPAANTSEPITITDTVFPTAAPPCLPIETTSAPVPETTEPDPETVQPIEETTDLAAVTSEPQPPETSRPSGPAPTEPKPTDPAPTQPKPTEPAPTQPKPTEPAPTEPKPTETTHVHSWGSWKQSLAPTCGKSGEETRSCTGCDAKETRSVAATGAHNWKETAPSCTQSGEKVCTVCGAKETIASLGHDWVHHEEAGHWQTLVTCYCGAQFDSVTDWHAHATASTDLDYLNIHAGYEAHEIWVVDTATQDVCSRCGTIK